MRAQKLPGLFRIFEWNLSRACICELVYICDNLNRTRPACAHVFACVCLCACVCADMSDSAVRPGSVGKSHKINADINTACASAFRVVASRCSSAADSVCVCV